MPFDAGSVVGRVTLDSTNFQKGAQNVTSSMLKAQVAFAVLQKAVRLVSDVIGDSINKFIVQEKVAAQMNAVLKSTQHAAGLTAKELQKMAGALQQTTTYGDEVIMGAQNILLTFTKIGKDVFPQATETVLDMSAALGQDLKSSAIQVGKALQDPILGVSALRRVGVNFSKDQQEVIRNLVETGRSAEAQALILKELQTEFGGSARAAAETFGGALKQLENNMNDAQEKLGGFVMAGAQPFIKSMSEGTTALNEFLTSAEAFDTVRTVMGAVTSVLTHVQDTITIIGKGIADVGKSFSEIFDLKGAEKNLGMLNTILSHVTAATQLFINIIKPIAEGLFKNIKTAADEVMKIFKDIFGEVKGGNAIFTVLGGILRTLSVGFAITGKVIKLVFNLVADFVGLVKANINVLGKFAAALGDFTNPAKWAEAKRAMDQVGESFVKLGKNAIDNVSGLVTETTTQIKNFGKGVMDNSKDLQKSYEDVQKASLAGMQKMQEAQKQNLENLQGDLNKTGEVIQGSIDKATSGAAATLEDSIKQMQDSVKEFTSAFMMAFDAVNAAVDQYYTNQETSLDNWYAKQKASIEANVSDEKERTAQLEALDKDYAKKQAKLKKEQFQNQKVASVISSIINTAVGVTQALSAAPPPFNFILAGIVAAAGAVQTALIAAQPVPQFVKGGVALPGVALVGEKGPELINIGSTSRILNNDETQAALNDTGGMAINFYDPIINRSTDLDEMLTLAGANIRAQKRGAN